ncbi:fatty acid desaturase [Pelagovum pacificum]|uniref:Fatty acid desaturase n=1 Tax=Pelagovum pacificum TaxID=2588711 RepID=A0A5C5GGS8_9RHOB|nr:fatty acid desaturase [Pelagovum pacificum]QQA43646.1 fatty acid desaturase [Pelagovum pacificum]TNY33219.1 fatty acid desaturase [Pelagovum pacificum]
MRDPHSSVEWPTLGLLTACYVAWGVALFWLSTVSLWLAVPVVAVAAAMHSSLQHEAIHGHPFRDRRLNALLVWPPLDLFVPYGRFRDTHLAHHHDAILTDPYDDPESNYLDPAVWSGLSRPVKLVLRMNNTLAGRMLIGPLAGMTAFIAGDWAQRRDGKVREAWLCHLPAVAAVLVLVVTSPMPVWAYLIAAYGAMSILKIRTFLEHQAHEKARARTVIIEDKGPLALLFLNNNLHVVHHMHPRVPWYRLPQVYQRNPDRYLGVNEGYRYGSYAEVIGRYLFKAKDPVPHPLRHG